MWLKILFIFLVLIPLFYCLWWSPEFSQAVKFVHPIKILSAPCCYHYTTNSFHCCNFTAWYVMVSYHVLGDSWVWCKLSRLVFASFLCRQLFLLWQVKGLYRGATSSFVGMAFESSLAFGIYSQTKHFLQVCYANICWILQHHYHHSCFRVLWCVIADDTEK